MERALHHLSSWPLFLMAFLLMGDVAIGSPPAVVIGNGGRSLTVIDTRTRAPIGRPRTLPNPGYAVLIEPTGKRAFVLSPYEHLGFPDSSGPGTLYLVDLEQVRIEEAIPLFHQGFNMASSPSGKTLYVAHDDANALSVIDVASRKVDLHAFPRTNSIAVSPDGERIYLGSGSDVIVLRASDLAVLERFSVRGQQLDVAVTVQIAVTPDGANLVALALGISSGELAWRLVVIPLRSDAEVWSLDLGRDFGHFVIDGGGRRVFLSGAADEVRVVDLVPGGQVVSIPLDRVTGGLALTPDDRELWVLDRDSARTWILDTQSLEVVGSVMTGAPTQLSFGRFVGPYRAPPGTETVVEFYHPGLDHYFITANAAEIAALDHRVHAGWGRTGQQFFSSANPAGANPVCRFYGLPSAGLDSHFYSASRSECEQLAAGFDGAWQEETADAFRIDLPDVDVGLCAYGTVPVWRFWNGRADSNHRYTTSPSIRDAMRRRGYVAEGYGDQQVAMCAAAPL